jgi:hypothetical protein
MPPGVVLADVDPLTGYLAGPNCPVSIEGVFPKAMAPTQTCPFHGSAGATIPTAAPAGGAPASTTAANPSNPAVVATPGAAVTPAESSEDTANSNWEAAPDNTSSPND